MAEEEMIIDDYDDENLKDAKQSSESPEPIQVVTIKHGDSKTPWIEKYRPLSFEEIVGNEGTMFRLQAFAMKGNMPNFILTGPPGVGKTTAIMCLARALLGDQLKNGVLELNASNERGIDVVRNKIKHFAQLKVTVPPGKHKLIILDEADSMTDGAQQALRRTMELFSKTTRFALACNNSEKLNAAIQSRCAVVRFGRLSDAEVMAKVQSVCEVEELTTTDEGIEAIVFTAQGDLRQALNNLQATHQGFGAITYDNVFKVCDEPSPLVIQKILHYCNRRKIKPAYELLCHIWKLGYAPEDIISTIYRVCKTADLPEYSKLMFIKEIGLTHLKIAEGVNTFIQLTGLLARLCSIKPS